MVEEVERAHLGTRARMSAASTGEQASAGLEPGTVVWKGI
jgi:hypothetical protein